ncbi:hypothetical protein JCM10908_001799 [Rhodotorula pacifica]|uniref:uncharacterized protein n=1 Tax=Rhodotorula pacifica TaxID=1495444 RepID=UPI003176AF30
MPKRPTSTKAAPTSTTPSKGKTIPSVPALRSPAWTSASSLFTSPLSRSKDDTTDTVSARSISSSSGSSLDFAYSHSNDSASVSSSSSSKNRQSQAVGNTLYTTPIPEGALVLLGGTHKSLSSSFSSQPPPTMAPSRRSTPSSAASAASTPPPGAAISTHSAPGGGGGARSGAGGRQTKVWAGPKGRMPVWQRWRIWYAGVSVIEMLETWESVLYHSIILVALFAVFCALAYLPAHVSTMIKRAQWYISGVDASA